MFHDSCKPIRYMDFPVQGPNGMTEGEFTFTTGGPTDINKDFTIPLKRAHITLQNYQDMRTYNEKNNNIQGIV